MAVFETVQRSLMYFPSPGPVAPANRYAERGRDVVLTTDDGLRLEAWWIPPMPHPTQMDRAMAVLFTPGNGGHREGRAPLFLALAGRGFGVLGLDYRGYGGNPGTPSEAGLAADARAAVDWLRAEGYGAERTIYLGESLGTGVAARLATTHPPAGMVLRSPFTSLIEVARHIYPWLPVEKLIGDRYPTLDYLAGCAAPVSVLRGGADGIVPNRLSARVAHAVPNLLEDVEVAFADHNDAIWFGRFVADAVLRIADAASVSSVDATAVE